MFEAQYFMDQIMICFGVPPSAVALRPARGGLSCSLEGAERYGYMAGLLYCYMAGRLRLLQLGVVFLFSLTSNVVWKYKLCSAGSRFLPPVGNICRLVIS